jgi:hypothetical protein
MYGNPPTMIKVDEDQARLIDAQMTLSRVKELLTSWSAYVALHEDGDEYRAYHAGGVRKCLGDLEKALEAVR